MRGARLPLVHITHGWASLREQSRVSLLAARIVDWLINRIASVTVLISRHEEVASAGLGLEKRALRIEHGLPAVKPCEKFDTRLSVIPVPGPIRLGFVGRFDRQKGVDLLLEAFAQCPPDRFTLTLIGAPVLCDSAAELNLQVPGVRFTGWLSQQEVDQLLCELDLLIVPSRWEGFGLVVLEAYRRSVPVVVSDRGNLPYLVRSGVTGYVFRLNDPQSLCGILKTLTSKDLSRMGRHAQALFGRRYGAPRMYRRYRRVFSLVLNRVEK